MISYYVDLGSYKDKSSDVYGVTNHEGHLYTVGNHSRIDMYDPVTNTWTLLAEKAEFDIGSAVALTNNPRI